MPPRYDARNGVRDGSWIVDPAVVERYRAMGIDALNDPTHADDSVARDIEANRMEYAQAQNLAARRKKKAYADENWNRQLGELGYSGTNWHKARNEMLANARAKGIDGEQMDWLWGAGPVAWQEAGLLGPAAPPPPTQPPPPVMPPTPITPTNIVTKPRPRPQVTTNRQSPAADFASMGVQPNSMSLGPASPSVVSGNPTPKPQGTFAGPNRRPPQSSGYMKQPKRTTAQLGF